MFKGAVFSGHGVLHLLTTLTAKNQHSFHPQHITVL